MIKISLICIIFMFLTYKIDSNTRESGKIENIIEHDTEKSDDDDVRNIFIKKANLVVCEWETDICHKINNFT